MIINIRSLKGHKGDVLTFSQDVPWKLAEEAPQVAAESSPLTVEGRVTNTGRGMYVEGSLSIKVRLNCTRCLEDYEQVLEAKFAEEYLPQAKAAELNQDNDEEWLDGIPTYHGDELDLQQLLWDTVLLSVPMKTICDADCKGLCHSCGQSLNKVHCNCTNHVTDPRLAALADLLKE